MSWLASDRYSRAGAALAELEAESVAFVVCDALGLDAGDWTFGYVAGWAGGGDAAILVGLFAPMHRVAQINEVTALTPELVMAAQESPVIGTVVNHITPKNYDG